MQVVLLTWTLVYWRCSLNLHSCLYCCTLQAWRLVSLVKGKLETYSKKILPAAYRILTQADVDQHNFVDCIKENAITEENALLTLPAVCKPYFDKLQEMEKEKKKIDCKIYACLIPLNNSKWPEGPPGHTNKDAEAYWKKKT